MGWIDCECSGSILNLTLIYHIMINFNLLVKTPILTPQPVSVVHFPPAITPNPLEDDDAIYDLPPDLFAPAPQRFQFLPNWLPQPRLPRPPHLARTTSAPLTRREPAYLIPERGAPVSLGVVIAMPFEGNRDHYWTREEDEEREVPQVVLGVVDARIE